MTPSDLCGNSWSQWHDDRCALRLHLTLQGSAESTEDVGDLMRMLGVPAPGDEPKVAEEPMAVEELKAGEGYVTELNFTLLRYGYAASVHEDRGQVFLGKGEILLVCSSITEKVFRAKMERPERPMILRLSLPDGEHVLVGEA